MVPVELAVVSLLVVAIASGCPTWTVNTTTTHCECGPELSGRISCQKFEENVRVEIQATVCMTFDEKTGTLLAGDCPYSFTANSTNRMYSLLPSDPAMLSDVCTSYNRKGLFCGRCIEGFGPSVYSLDLKCVNCSDISTGYAVTLYIVLETIPITIFFFSIVLFRFNFTSGPMLPYIIFCQCMYISLQDNLYHYNLVLAHMSKLLLVPFHASLVVSGVWNLQFLKFLLPSFCISSKLTDLHVYMLRFISILYPLLLLLVTYAMIQIYVWRGRVLHFLFDRCFSWLGNDWRANDSLIHAFAILTVLFAAAVNYRVINIIAYTDMYNINGTVTKTASMHDPLAVWSSAQHFPYVIAALLLLFLVVLCPALLVTIYPTRLYRKLFQCLSARKRIAIQIFVDSVVCGFKDGLNGSRDYRMLPGVSVLIIIPLSFLLDVYPMSVFFYFIASFMSLSVRPCKSEAMNMSLSFHNMLYGFLKVCFLLWTEALSISTESLANFIGILVTVPHIVMLVWAGYKVLAYTRVRMQIQQTAIYLKQALENRNTLLFCCKNLSKRRRGYEELTAPHSTS